MHPFTILLHIPLPPIVSSDIIFPFTYMCTQYLYHIHPPSQFPHLHPPPTGTIPLRQDLFPPPILWFCYTVFFVHLHFDWDPSHEVSCGIHHLSGHVITTQASDFGAFQISNFQIRNVRPILVPSLLWLKKLDLTEGKYSVQIHAGNIFRG
jgi:hypothetical protein